MKKLTAILLFVCTAFCAVGAYAVDSYGECESQVFREVAFNPSQEYNNILDSLVKEAKDKAANWAKTPINSKNLFCELNGVTVYNAPCENKTPQECGVPEGCWCLLAQISCDKMLLGQAAKEKYTQQKCGKKSSPVSSVSNNTANGNSVAPNNTENDTTPEDKQAKKSDDKAKECGAKGKVAKQDKLGIWSCVYSDEAKESLAKEKAQKEYAADISKIVAAYQKKYQQLSKKNK